MPDLSASELPLETLRAGDKIEYYSHGFVCGDKRGHRTALVLRADDAKDAEFPIAVDTEEAVPLSSDMDNDGHEHVAGAHSTDIQLSEVESVSNEQQNPIRALQTEENEATVMPPSDREVVNASEYLKNIPDRHARAEIRHQKKRKAGQWHVSRSRKRRDQAKCGITRSGTQIYHARTVKAFKIKKHMAMPGVKQRLKALHARRPNYVAPKPDQRFSHEEVEWPADVEPIDECKTHGVSFPDLGEYHKYQCYGDCFLDTCDNVGSAVYCTEDRCNLGALCSNAPRSRDTLKLFDTARVGFGLYTTTGLDVGDIVGECTGDLSEYPALVEGQPPEAVKKNSRYTLLYKAKSVNKKCVYVGALLCGSMTRFISHACNPNAAFVEVQNRANVKVLIRMLKDVKTGAQITVHYGTETWFKYAWDECWSEPESDGEQHD